MATGSDQKLHKGIINARAVATYTPQLNSEKEPLRHTGKWQAKWLLMAATRSCSNKFPELSATQNVRKSENGKVKTQKDDCARKE